MTTSLVTTSHQFSKNGQEFFFATVPGLSCGGALNVASAILQGAESFCCMLIDSQRSAAEVSAIRILIEQAKALIDASVVSVERAEDLVPQSQSSPIRGAEARQ
ncbi:hypothetical protein [Pseudomonas mosselii]|uniref:hypothetical protein n=1 Tax=Pseudomonas mosselii TaxID=78327 RepID=UPI000C12BF98|nr:hypothetical protein [Pseudomonas mosselii]